MNKRIGVAAVGNVLDINCWSNIPYYFFLTGKEKSVFHEPWQLELHKFNKSRILWNISNILLGRGKGGYQYSKTFLNKAESQIPETYFSSTVITFNQIFPRASSIKKKSGKIYYYIDISLYDLFNESAYEIEIPNWIKKQALIQETDNYHRADAVVCMGSWVKDSLVNFYKLPESKIFTVLPGANITIPENFSFPEKANSPGNNYELKLGFIGKDWKRKGLPILIIVAEILTKRGYKIKIKVIGNCPEELKNHPNVEYSGFINKHKETEKFIREVSSCDIGCLFSSSEALGISTLEFLKLGIPVAGYYHQGLIDTLLDGCSLRFNLNSGENEIADAFEAFINDSNAQRELKKNSESQSYYVSWQRCIDDWKNLLQL